MLMLKNEYGVVKKAPVGFSFTVLFFGFLVPLLRGDLKWSAIMFIASLAVGAITFGFGAVFVWIFFAVKYNELYLDELKEKGYKVM